MVATLNIKAGSTTFLNDPNHVCKLRKATSGMRHLWFGCAAFVFLVGQNSGAIADTADKYETKHVNIGQINIFKIFYSEHFVPTFGTIRECAASAQERIYPPEGPSIPNVNVSITLFRQEDDTLKGAIMVDHSAFHYHLVPTHGPMTVGIGNVRFDATATYVDDRVMATIPSDATWLLSSNEGINLGADYTIHPSEHIIFAFNVKEGAKINDALRRCADERLQMPQD